MFAPKGYEPATWFRSTSFGDEKDRVMVKSDGAPTYTLPDIAYHCDKLERGFDIAVNVLGTDHFSQAQVVKYGVEALGMNPEPIQVIFNQMVRAVRWNDERGEYEAVKQSKRAGDFDTLDDLVADDQRRCRALPHAGAQPQFPAGFRCRSSGKAVE